MGNIPETPSPTSSPIFSWFPWIFPVKSARAIWDIVWSILDSLKYQSHATGVWYMPQEAKPGAFGKGNP